MPASEAVDAALLESSKRLHRTRTKPVGTRRHRRRSPRCAQACTARGTGTDVNTMLDVARRAGVSISTVSYALNGTRPVSAATRARIEAAMAELKYTPNLMARGLRGRRSKIIALVFPGQGRGIDIS